uniref:protein cornichon homolog 1-like n=1 Tax=Myxine glutinosa TaxID=7769 RepID=UPI00358E7994
MEISFTFAVFCYMLAFLLSIALIFFAVCHIIAFDELKKEMQASLEHEEEQIQCHIQQVLKVERICCMLRKLLLPEYFIHALFCVMFLCSMEWLTLGLNTPLLCYHVWRFFHRPALRGLYSPGVLMSSHMILQCQREAGLKLAFYLLSFFYYLYSMIYTLISQ